MVDKILDQFMAPRAKRMIEFAADQEPWAQYRLENGAIVRIRIMMVKAMDSGEFSPDGLPMINFQMQQVMDVTWPDDILGDAEARRKANGQ